MNYNDQYPEEYVPDEYVAHWKEESIERLMRKNERLFQHIETLQDHDQRKEMERVMKHLEAYIEKRIKEESIDVDSFL